MYNHTTPIRSAAPRRPSAVARPAFERSLHVYAGKDGRIHGLSGCLSGLSDDNSSDDSSDDSGGFFDTLVSDLSDATTTVVSATGNVLGSDVNKILSPNDSTKQTTTQKVVSTATTAVKTAATSYTTYALLAGAGLIAFMLLKKK